MIQLNPNFKLTIEGARVHCTDKILLALSREKNEALFYHDCQILPKDVIKAARIQLRGHESMTAPQQILALNMKEKTLETLCKNEARYVPWLKDFNMHYLSKF